MSFSPIQGSALIEKQYKRYLGTMFSLNDADYQQQFTRQLNDHSMFAVGPYLDAHDNFATGHTIRQLVNDHVLPRYFLKYNFYLDRPLYVHQETALRKALDKNNIVVSTGTGSGKTESFLMPILAGLAEEAENGTLTNDVRALLIYPMNALANDQVERLRELLKDTPDVTFGCYTGQTREKTTEALAEYIKLNKKQPLKNELISREQMKKRQPHILITNYAMLEYLMVRPDDSVFFSCNTWRYIVLDEAHVYRGSTGIEVGMLLRRLKATLNCESLQYFITSATLGDENENDAVAEFASTLTDEPFSACDVIRAVRVPVPRPQNELSIPVNIYQVLAEKIDAGESKDKINQWVYENLASYGLNSQKPLFDLVHRDENYWKLRNILKTPSPINEIAAQLGISECDIEHLVTVASFCEEDGIRLLDARYHTFLRATDSVFVTLSPSKKLFLTRKKEHLEPADGRTYRVFEIAACSACHAIYLIGKLDNDTGCFEQNSKLGTKDLFYLGTQTSKTDEDTQNDETEDVPGTLCAICGHFHRNKVRNDATCSHSAQFFVPVVQVKRLGEGHRLKKCVCCEAVNNYGILRSFFTGQEAVTSVIATSLFNALPDKTSVSAIQTLDEDDFGFGFSGAGSSNDAVNISQAKQFLCFSDSRQASAYFATYLDTSYRKLLYRRVLAEQTKSFNRPMLLREVCEDLEVFFERKGFLKGTAYRMEKESWKAVLAEAADITSDVSLSGMGMMSFGLEPGIFQANPMLNMSAEEVNMLLNVLISSMINDLAIQIPVAMTEEDREFYSYGAMGARYVALGGDSSKNLKSFIPKNATRSNKRFDYLKRILNIKKPSAFDDDNVRKMLMALWKMLLQNNIIVPYDDGYQLNTEKLFIHRPSRWYRCSKCHKLTPYNIAGVCMTYHCQGNLDAADPDTELSDNHYYRLCHDMELRPLRVKEHTAQLNRDKAYEYQQDFKDKKIDVLSCSTTFEMGVDVGSLETVFMRNMPPMPSNYAQRAGRAGRSRNSAAFALTFCNRSNHDFAYFDRPVDMINGRIHAPHFSIHNEKIAIRHLYASAMAFFWRAFPRFFSTVGQMSSISDGIEENGFSLLRKYLSQKPESLKEFAKRFLPVELYCAFGCDHYGWLEGFMNVDDGVLTRAVSEYDYEVNLLEQARQEAFLAHRSTGYFEQRLRNYRNESILSFMSRKNVMPQYGFPVDTVSLSITGKTNNQQYGVELQRDLAMAISEYAPDSQVVANGELFTGRYIRKVPSIGWKSYDYVYCKECGTLNIHLHTSDEDIDASLVSCHVCGALFDHNEIKTFIIPAFGFEIDPDDIKRPGLIRPEKTYRTDVSYVGYRNGVELKPMAVRNTEALVLFSENDEMAVLNQSDFYICQKCGYGETSHTFFLDSKKEHLMPSGRKCGNSFLKRLSLGYRFETDVFMMHFPDYPLIDSAEANSVMYAFIRGIADVLDLEENDIAGCLQSMNTVHGRGYCLVFYDTTPGGAGHMRRLQNVVLLNKAIDRASELMKRCTCGGPEGHASCYACLRSYRNQKLHDILDRSLAIQYFSQL